MVFWFSKRIQYSFLSQNSGKVIWINYHYQHNIFVTSKYRFSNEWFFDFREIVGNIWGCNIGPFVAVVWHIWKGDFLRSFYNIPKIQIQYNIAFIPISIFFSSSVGWASVFNAFTPFSSASNIDVDTTIFEILWRQDVLSWNIYE